MEEMRADRIGHHQLPVPGWGYRIGMVMRRQPDRREHISAQRRARDAQRLAPRCARRSEEHTSELQSLMRNSYAVFCLKTKNQQYIYATYITMTISSTNNTTS